MNSDVLQTLYTLLMLWTKQSRRHPQLTSRAPACHQVGECQAALRQSRTPESTSLLSRANQLCATPVCKEGATREPTGAPARAGYLYASVEGLRLAASALSIYGRRRLT
jgi:hypothetical protein